jgi:hypothetical protein
MIFPIVAASSPTGFSRGQAVGHDRKIRSVRDVKLRKHLQNCDGRMDLPEPDGPAFESFRIAVI